MRLTPRAIAYITLLIYWGPLTLLYYAWGFLIFFFLVLFKKDWLRANGTYSIKIVLYSLAFTAVFFISFLINYFWSGSSFNNLIWSIFTYGSTFLIMLSLLFMPFREEDLKKIFMFSLYLTLIQVFVGYFQMLESQSFQQMNPFSGGQDAGDYFVGTTFNIGIGSLVAIKMSLTTLLFIPFWMADKCAKNSVMLVILFLGWVLASAIFTIIIGVLVIFFFFFIRKIIMALYTHKISKYIVYSMVLVVVGTLIFVLTQEKNIEYLTATTRYAYYTVMDIDAPEKVESRKVHYYKKTLGELPFEYPHALLVGVGPGNYSSRSAWMVSGEYLEKQPSYMPATPSEVAEKYTLSIWSKDMISEGFKDAGSITHQPFSTWLSVFAETGLIGLLLFSYIFVYFKRAFRITSRISNNLFLHHVALGLRMSLLYILLLFFLENLFEYPLVMGQFFVFACMLIRITEKNIKKVEA